MDNLAEIVRQQGEIIKALQEQQTRNIPVPWPTPMNVHNDPEQSFKTFLASWTNYCRAAQIDKWPPDQISRKISVLMSAIGEEALKKYNNFGLDLNKIEGKYEEIIEMISTKMIPQKNVIYNRYVFNSKKQTPGEAFETFYSDLMKLVEDCDYKEWKDDMLRDRIVLGIQDIKVRRELLRKEKLTLLEAVNICRAAEITNKQMQTLTNSDGSYDTIKKIDKPKDKRRCKFCDGTHEFIKGKCPAYGKVCEYCKGKNHIAKACKKKQNNKIKNIETREESNSDGSPEEEEYSLVINKLSQKGHSDSEAECTIKYKKKKKWHDIKCLIDTGADECLVGIENLKKMYDCNDINQKLKLSHKKLYDFGGHNIIIEGEFDIKLKHKTATHNVTFQVVQTNHKPLLSYKISKQMGLIKICKKILNSDSDTRHLINKYDSVFQGFGRFSGELDLEIDTEVRPVVQKARRVPLALREPLKEELHRLEQQGIIQKEENHTDWVSNILIVQKNKNFRICLDPIPLNKAIKRPNYQFTTIDEVLPELGKAKIFSTFDVKKGFWHLRLSEESSKLTTFWTPFGKYRWNVLPFGIASASDYFQMRMYEIVHDLPGVELLVDDILVYGIGNSQMEAISDHNKKLDSLLQRLSYYNCKLNKDKMKLLQTSVAYYGHIFTTEGLKPDSVKIQAIQTMPIPKDKKELQRFLGMVTYLSRFIPNLSTVSTHLRQLTHEKSVWLWDKHANKEFDKIKSLICDIKNLKYYDRTQPLIIECDSSGAALGVAVLQDNQPVAYASRTLTLTEKKYAQIEKELLAVVFACTRFDQLIVGNPKTVIRTDHKPLLNIFKKPLLSAPKRLQSMLLVLQRYCIELEFIAGKDNILADTLSRLYVSCNDIEKSTEKKIFKIIEQINPLHNISLSDKSLLKVAEATSKDIDFKLLSEYINDGWPRYISDVPDSLRQYYSFRDELTTYRGLILKNQAIIIPQSLRKQVLEKLHKAHSGMENTLKLARDLVFWPSISTDIKNMVKTCSVCIKYLPSQKKFPMQSHEIPEYPFQRISMDVFFINKNGRQCKYLITVDHYSDFFEIDKLKDLSAKSVIDNCKKNFARHGIPEVVCTDGGTNFVNNDFSIFSLEWNFIHVTSSPNHQQGNGKAEATVKIAKRMLLKSLDTKEDYWLSLLNHRNTPNKINSSPVQRIFSRRTRGSVPIVQNLLKPYVIPNVPHTITRKREVDKYYYDRKSTKATKLEIGQPVVVQLHPSVNKYWTPGYIEDILSDRSYLINVNDSVYRRDLIHIRPCQAEQDPTDRSYDINQTHDTTQEALPDNLNLTPNSPPRLDTNKTSNFGTNENNTQTNETEKDISSTPPINLYDCNNLSARPKREARKPVYLKDYVT